jgi:hypothetical protein
MSMNTWQETLVDAQVDGTTLTAAARATALAQSSKYTLPANFFSYVGKKLHVYASGRISCVVTTPGTARYDLTMGGTIVFDSLAMNLNVVAKVSVHWELDVTLTARAIGSTGNLFGQGSWKSEAVVGSPLPTVGGSGVLLIPVGTAPGVGGNFDTSIAQQIDLFFTQTVATGSMTLHQFQVEALN